jgi:hypothetical protein
MREERLLETEEKEALVKLVLTLGKVQMDWNDVALEAK